MVVGYISTLAEVEHILSGWPAEMEKPNGIAWAAERLRSNGVPAVAPS
jgi:hypothetical protein